MNPDMREILANLEHQQWAHWTSYMLNNLTEENIKRWHNQTMTDYEDLTEKEKDSDRVWADRVMKTITIHNYNEAFGSSKTSKKSEEKNPAHFCMGNDCNKYLGHRGFCSTKCHDSHYDA